MIPREVHEQNLRVLLEPVAALLDDPSVDEIMINGPARIYAERAGRVFATPCCFEHRDALLSAVRAIAQYAGHVVDPESPVLEARLPDGSRFEAVIPPAAPDGPIVSVRRFKPSSLRASDLVALGSLSADACALLRELVTHRKNLLVAGGTGSGKTSLLNAIAGFIPEGERVIVIEDARELQLAHEHVVQLEARPPDARGRGQVTVRKLFTASLRLRPDRIVLGEIRGGEALELIQAMTSGHAGCLATIHAASPRDALARLETLALMSDVALPLSALRAQIASAVEVIVQTSRRSGGARSVDEISEVRAEASGYAFRPLHRAAHARRSHVEREENEP